MVSFFLFFILINTKMVKYFILIKRKNSKSWLGAIPARAGATLAQLKRIATKPGFVKKVISSTQLKSLVARIKPKGAIRRKVRRKSVKRKVRRKSPKRTVRRKRVVRRRKKRR